MANKYKEAAAVRDILINQLQETLDIGKTAETTPQLLEMFKLRFQRVASIYDSLLEKHVTIVSLVSTLTLTTISSLDAEEVIRRNFDKTYYEINALHVKLFPPAPVQPVPEAQLVPNGGNHNKLIKLPKVQLRHFDGSLSEWTPFFQLFTESIHNNTDLSNIEKFQYLLGCLSNEPLSLVKSLILSNENYPVAYKTLKERYDNKRNLANYYWNKINTLSQLKEESSRGLRNLLDAFKENLSALRALSIADSLEDFILTNMLMEKLDTSTRRHFESSIRDTNQDIPNFESLEKFIEGQCHVLETMKVSSSSQKAQSSSWRQKPHFENKKSALLCNSSPQSASNLCSICNKPHLIYSCPIFLQAVPSRRFELAKNKHLCVNCLRTSHQVRTCPSKSVCRHCQKTHHSLLHFTTNTSPSEHSLVESKDASQEVVKPDEQSKVLALKTSTTSSSGLVLLATALVEARDSSGNYHTLRAVLDGGSEASFITDRCVRRLQLKCTPHSIQIRGISASSELTSNKSVNIRIYSKSSRDRSVCIDAHVVPFITNNLPSATFDISQWDHISNLNLADSKYNLPQKTDLLLGADVYAHILQPGVIHGPPHTPSAINTIFGWVVSGQVSPSTTVNSLFVAVSTTPSLDDTMKMFWSVEEIPEKSRLSDDDVRCEELFVKNHSRLPSGRYVVSLPFRESEFVLGDSKTLAFRRFLSLEHRLLKNPSLYRMYSDYMQEYLDNGHMSIANVAKEDDPCYYIPHHCVLKPGSATTKLRVVFDASMPSSSGLSLNDALLVGPKLQQDIVTLLLNFRIFPLVFTADIKQMYRQIRIVPEQWNYQRIFWRFDSNQPIEEYWLQTVTFGVSSAPFLALRTIQQLATDEQSSFPKASAVLKEHIFVDDILTGAFSVKEAVELIDELNGLLEKGGFVLRKWASNNLSVLNSVPSDRHQTTISFDTDSQVCVKILGLLWKPLEDTFSYRFETSKVKLCTKRTILSELARIYDPMGYITPVTFFVKCLLQSLWCAGLDWDQTPPRELVEKWQRFQDELSAITEISIPRHIPFERKISRQLHGFCDSSELGYGCVIYCRILNQDGSITNHLLMAKSKVAPLRKLTIPRLELCGAVLLAKSINFIVNVYSKHLSFQEVFAWTDSTIALSWIRSSPHRWKTFVGNRVSYIQERVAPNCWHKVSSDQNPADCASRGLLPSDLVTYSPWWNGPHWLRLPVECWPISENLVDPDSHIISDEQRVTVLTTSIEINNCPWSNLMERCSSLQKILRVAAFAFRFIHRSKRITIAASVNTDAIELHGALLKLVRLVQHQIFGEEIKKLQSNQPCSKQFRKLNVFLDENDVLRVGGRLRHSLVPFEQKFPALLPKSHRLTSLIIEDAHRRYCHPGQKTLHYLIRQNFWIISAAAAIRRCISNCYRCFRAAPRPLEPFMGDLPSYRVQQIKPFQSVGVDFGGPFIITFNRGRGGKTTKAYICLFICLATKAIHIEIVSDLSTEAFLAALRRFIARRGRCTEIRSDCGTNFIGANRILQSYFQNALDEERITWKFNPPSAPHFGGIWEAGMKSVKTHLTRVVGNQILTLEELTTVTVQIEALLNSRPLCPLSNDPNDLEVLTPGHFITLAPLTAIPEPDYTETKIGRLKRWQLLQQMQQHFWARWHNEYLNVLQQREKWLSKSSSLKSGDLVLIKDDHSPPLKWRVGRVLQVFPNQADKICRVASVKTTQGIMRRPFVKLCPLPSASG